MIRNKQGFTLIELLVVVLIIGILAAVAVPMYKRAVLKSQFSTLMPLAKNLWEGNEIYYLNNGEYAASVDELDVSAPADPKVQATLGDEEKHQYVQVSNPDISNRLKMYQKHSPNFAGETHCEALLNDDLANWLCKDSLQGTFVGNKFGYAVYTLSPEAVGTLARTVYNYNIPNANKTFSDGDVCVGTESYKCRRGWGTLQFDNGAKCVALAGATYSCSAVNGFSNESVCIGKNSGTCQSTTFDHSYCVGDSMWACCETACRDNTFKNYSVCYANKADACVGRYDETSCCTGSFCTQDKCEDKEAWQGREIPPMPTYP